VLVLYDLNGFKQYNDSFGHQAGDALLRRLGNRLADGVGERGGAYRMGGDEFCLLAPLGDGAAATIAQLGAGALSERGDGFSISCAYGIALVPAEARTAEEALRIADQRMYEHKAPGPRVPTVQPAY
jgi:diguanylate cyclase (GGDEF)-like protein